MSKIEQLLSFSSILVKVLTFKKLILINSINFVPLIKHLIPFCLFSLIYCTTSAQDKDTMLNMVISKPFFYNVLQGKDGNIYTGTSEGIFKVVGTDLIEYNNKKGYITLDKEGLPVINPEGIKNYNEKKYLYLLPYPDQARDEYHAGTDELFYICSGGRLHIFDILPYVYSYPNHSIRAVSENFVGTYSGLYFKEKKLDRPFPKYTESYIREFKDKTFICSGYLMAIESSALLSNPIDTSKLINKYYPEILNDAIVDIHLSGINQQYYIAAQKTIYTTDANLQELHPIYSGKENSNGICILGDYFNEWIYFSYNHFLLGFNTSRKTFDTIARISDPIVSGCTDIRHTYVLSNNALFVVNSDRSVEKLIEVEKAHSLVKVSSTELVIASDVGLFLFNTVSKQLSTLVNGVEFNRRALYIKDNIVYAGSINGLYSINAKDFTTLIRSNTQKIKKSELPLYVLIIGAVIIVLAIVLLLLLVNAQQKLKKTNWQIKEIEKETLNREKIELFIRENLAIASLKSIAEHFNTNNSMVYQLLEPDKPGSIITTLRTEVVVEMKKKGINIEQIAEATGLSESYIRKIKAGK